MTLAIPTADNTVILASSLNFTADGANLVNGGGIEIPEAPKGQNFNKLSVTTSQILSIFAGQVT
jgi:hypothetical protein